MTGSNGDSKADGKSSIRVDDADHKDDVDDAARDLACSLMQGQNLQ